MRVFNHGCRDVVKPVPSQNRAAYVSIRYPLMSSVPMKLPGLSLANRTQCRSQGASPNDDILGPRELQHNYPHRLPDDPVADLREARLPLRTGTARAMATNSLFLET